MGAATHISANEGTYLSVPTRKEISIIVSCRVPHGYLIYKYLSCPRLDMKEKKERTFSVLLIQKLRDHFSCETEKVLSFFSFISKRGQLRYLYMRYPWGTLHDTMIEISFRVGTLKYVPS